MALPRLTTSGALLAAQLAAVVLLAAAFGAVLEDVVERDDLVSIDAPVATFLAAHREHWLTRALEVATWAGSAMVLVPLVLLTGIAMRRTTRSWRPLLFLAASLAGASALSNLIKLAVARARPDHRLVHAVGYSFPSGHATAATAAWLSIAIALGTLTARRRRRVALVVAASIVAAIVGLSRVYLRVHWATDVLGGWALGGLWVTAVFAVVTARDRRRGASRPSRTPAAGGSRIWTSRTSVASPVPSSTSTASCSPSPHSTT
jgi:membrane-associated phospholipid phosphatase